MERVLRFEVHREPGRVEAGGGGAREDGSGAPGVSVLQAFGVPPR